MTGLINIKPIDPEASTGTVTMRIRELETIDPLTFYKFAHGLRTYYTIWQSVQAHREWRPEYGKLLPDRIEQLSKEKGIAGGQFVAEFENAPAR
ncbi:MAG: hypothetical protein ABJH63_12550 [Rhizobiaceae bacterium]